MDVVYALKRQGRTLYGFEEMGFVGVGLWVILVRKRWFWRSERDEFVGFERGEEKEERFGGGGSHRRRWEEERRRWEEIWRKLRFDCVCYDL
jgi:hypothetical protein